jgi:hypothetical protein
MQGNKVGWMELVDGNFDFKQPSTVWIVRRTTGEFLYCTDKSDLLIIKTGDTP